MPTEGVPVPGKKPRDDTVRVRDAEKTRAKIIAAARQEFSEKGFNGARVDKIAECAGVNKRMLYYYYDTKENLYHEVLQEIMANEGPQLDSPDLPTANGSLRPSAASDAPMTGSASFSTS